MPPKRKALEPADANANYRSNGNKAKPDVAQDVTQDGAQNDALDAQARKILLEATLKEREKRWAKVSGTKNLDLSYHTSTQDPAHAYELVCICNPLERRNKAFDEEDEDDYDDDDDDDDSDDYGDEDEDNDDDGTVRNTSAKNTSAKTPSGNVTSGQVDEPKQACDGETCSCGKTAESLPSHPYTMTRAGLARNRTASDMVDLRNPDAFNMYTFNDHMAYGTLEVVQNMMLDFDEAYKAQQWQAAWSVVEGMSLFMALGEADATCMADDGERIQQTVAMIARMALAGLAMLDSNNQLAIDSVKKNVGWVIGLYREMAESMQAQDILRQGRPSKAKTFKFDPSNLEDYLQAYAQQHGITVPGVANTPQDADLTMPNLKAKDPWVWARSFADYQRSCGVSSGHVSRGAKRSAIGGDSLDITTWSSAERKQQAFDKKDPLPKEVIKNLKEGLVMTLG